MIVREHFFFHGAILTTDDKEFVSKVQREDNLSERSDKTDLLTHYQT